MGDTQKVPADVTVKPVEKTTVPPGWVAMVSVPDAPAVKPAPPIENGLATCGELPDPPLPTQANWA